jgi:hypothetical protein
VVKGRLIGKSMATKRNTVKAVAYLRTSSAANMGTDKDSEKRQRSAIESYAKRAGIEIVETFYDPAVSGADPVHARPGFAATSFRAAQAKGNVWRGQIEPSQPAGLARRLARGCSPSSPAGARDRPCRSCGACRGISADCPHP